MREVAVQFDDNRLVGIFNPSTSNNNEQAKTKPAIIFLNAGLLHRVGPFRLHVDLARDCAAMGWPSLRYDCSNVGDSENHVSEGDFQDHILQDGICAMDYIQENYGIHQFVLMGLCSGADNAHKLSARDSRVIGTVFWDGYSYPTLKFYWIKFRRKIRGITSKRIVNLFKRIVLKQLSLARTLRGQDLDLFVWELPPKEKTSQEILLMIDRKVKQLYFYSSGALSYNNYPEQLYDNFPGLEESSLATVAMNENWDHTYTLLSHRREMIEILKKWLLENF